jgi:hypothetical protein
VDSADAGSANFVTVLSDHLHAENIPKKVHGYRSLAAFFTSGLRQPKVVVLLSLVPNPAGEIEQTDLQQIRRLRCDLCVIYSAYLDDDPVFQTQVSALTGPKKIVAGSKWTLGWVDDAMRVIRNHLLESAFAEQFAELFGRKDSRSWRDPSSLLATLSWTAREAFGDRRFVDPKLEAHLNRLPMDTTRGPRELHAELFSPWLRVTSTFDPPDEEFRTFLGDIEYTVRQLTSSPVSMPSWDPVAPLRLMFGKLRTCIATEWYFLVDTQGTKDQPKIVIYVDDGVFGLTFEERQRQLLLAICRSALRRFNPFPLPAGIAFEDAFCRWAVEYVCAKSIEPMPTLPANIPLDHPENLDGSYAVLWFLREHERWEILLSSVWQHSSTGVVEALSNGEAGVARCLQHFFTWAFEQGLLEQTARQLEGRQPHASYNLQRTPSGHASISLETSYPGRVVGFASIKKVRAVGLVPLPAHIQELCEVLVVNSSTQTGSPPGARRGITWRLQSVLPVESGHAGG